MAVLSTFRKEERQCPVCETKFKEEFMLTGGLRQVNIKTTKELRTYYKDFKGILVIPFMYDVLTCPKCYFSALLQDFNELYHKKPEAAYSNKEKSFINDLRVKILKEKPKRDSIVNKLNNINFNDKKNMETALAGYMLAIECYDYFNTNYIPDTKKAVCAIRAAWLANDLKNKNLEIEYYRKAHKFYTDLVNRPDNSAGFKLGPDWGNNFGFEGARYIKCILDLKFLNEVQDLKEKFEILKNIRATFSKIRGFGKASTSKPGPLLKHSEDMFEEIQPLYEKIKNKVESGDFKVTDDVKINADKIIDDKKPEDKNKKLQEIEDDNSDIKPDLNTSVYHKAAVEIVKYAQKSAVKRNSIKDLEKILRNIFKEYVEK